jgi:hypothetical protein
MEKFDIIKEKHPNWSDEQIWSAVSLDMEADRVIEEKGEISPDDPDIIEEIIRGAMEWLDDALPMIMEKVRDLFNALLQNIGNWLRKGMEYVMDFIGNWFTYGF